MPETRLQTASHYSRPGAIRVLRALWKLGGKGTTRQIRIATNSEAAHSDIHSARLYCEELGICSRREAIERRQVRTTEKGKRVLRHQADDYFGSICRFLDAETRHCTVYKARPGICRDFPGTRRCGYWEFLKFERSSQEDPEYVATTNNY